MSSWLHCPRRRLKALEVIGVRRSMAIGFFVLLVLGLATPAWAQDAQTTEAFVVLSGRADVPEGQQNGDVVVFNGRVELRSGANVTGDVVSQNEPVVASGATIGGERRRVQTNVNWEGFGWAGRLAWWLAVSVSTLVIGVGAGVAGWAGRRLDPGGGADQHRPGDRLGAAGVLRPADPGDHR